jgi:hypothetical protein
MNKQDKVTNWFDHIPKEFKKASKKDPTYKDHMIKPNSMIVTIAPTGGGKTNSVVEFLSRKNGRFYEIIIFTGSSKDEPLYNFLASRIDGLQLIDDIASLPQIENYKDDDKKDLEKLIVFDDSVMLDPKLMKHVCKWFMCARKLGFTCMFLSQDYVSIPTFIRRNAHYLQLFKLADASDAKRILNKCAMDIDISKLKKMLTYCTGEKGNFLTIAVNEPTDEKYRKNFSEILHPADF